MERINGDEKWRGKSNSEEEEEEEALSLCDLPVSLATEDNQSKVEEANKELQSEEEDFDFGSWGASLFTESSMCAADEVFFQGQILPLRLSVSSDSGLTRSRQDSHKCNSRSASMDYRCSGGFSSSSSRSSSSRSHHSLISTSSNTTTTTTTNYKPRVRNQFHTHPSPKPQLRIPSIQHGNVGGRNRNSSMWDFFRLGLVRAPEIELQDLKLRTHNSNKTVKSFGSRNSNSHSNSNSGSSSNSSCNAKHRQLSGSNDDGQNSSSPGLTRSIKKSRSHRLFTKDGAFFSGCKCSAGAVETVTSSIVIIKSDSSCSGAGNDESETHVTKEKLQQLKKQKQLQHQLHQGKHAMSRHRTFEWLKELSLEADLDEA